LLSATFVPGAGDGEGVGSSVGVGSAVEAGVFVGSGVGVGESSPSFLHAVKTPRTITITSKMDIALFMSITSLL
jgi:hypothetical protein